MNLNLHTSTRISTSSRDTSVVLLDELDELWEEQLIQDLFRGNLAESEGEKALEEGSDRRLEPEIAFSTPKVQDKQLYLDAMKREGQRSETKLNRRNVEQEQGDYVNDRRRNQIIVTTKGDFEDVIMAGNDLPVETKAIIDESETVVQPILYSTNETKNIVMKDLPVSKDNNVTDSNIKYIDNRADENNVQAAKKSFKIHSDSADVSNNIKDDTQKLPNSVTYAKQGNNLKDSTDPEKTISNAKSETYNMVLILTESRHGSTWLMDLLSYPNTSVPVFEPLNSPFLKMYAQNEEVRAEAMSKGHDPLVYHDWRAVALARLCLCDFHANKIEKSKFSGTRYGGISGLGYKAKRLGTNYKDEVALSMRICGTVGSLVVPKTIRLYNISELSLLPEFGCHNFKILHLVRDPRAVLLSRMSVFRELYDGNKLLGEQIETDDQHLFSEEYMRQAAADLCSHHLHSYREGINPPDWLKDRYKLVKYEDVAADPDRWAQDLFHFVGIPYTDRYKQYVYNTTHIKERGEKEKGSYSVERESKEIINSWKKKLIPSHWKTIEHECKDLLDIMGYKRDY